ncbi:MAG: RecQ family ATP-dependent DNA helicase [Anaerolineae bacterium]|nr:RecQ family ATP-dependent DNA helicase [Anaerolineae bacterium]
MTDDILNTLGLTPAHVPDLPSQTRNRLISYLLRWEHLAAARDCLEALSGDLEHRVSLLDNLARAYAGLGDAARAVDTMRRRNTLRASNSSRILEAQMHLAAGDLPAARATALHLQSAAPDMLGTWNLQADVCLAEGDLDAAEVALRRIETLNPGSTVMAAGLARVWQARGDPDQALLWARTALSRLEAAERTPSVTLLRLLESLYRAAGHLAQAEATAARLAAQQSDETVTLREELDLLLPTTSAPAIPKPSRPSPRSPARPAPERPAGSSRLPTFPPSHLPPIELTPDEHSTLTTALHAHFPHSAFREGQAETIAAVLRGESVLAVMPTGAGKSLCYQLAATLLPGTALVISPLIALMKDQLDGLPDGLAAEATALNYTLDGAELDARLARVAAGECRLVYAAPERLRQRPFLHALKQAGVSLLVVDEAHCVSLWGHDFRPDYRFIAHAWRELGRPRILGMTATATPRVQDDIRAALGDMRLIATDVHRPNLHLEAHSFANEKEKSQVLVALCRAIEGSLIVYANSRQKCEDLAALLRRARIDAIHYHAGLDDRAAAQDQWMSGRARVVVATIALGMGIDKADVRAIIHYNPPMAIENYYQEAGRAGRDGQPARCVLFHSSADWANLSRWTRQAALDVDFLRQVYAAVGRRLAGREVGLLSTADLERDLGSDETRVRVAVHFLETAGLLWRGFNLPRTATLLLRVDPAALHGKGGGALRRFAEVAHLRPGQSLSRDLIALAADAATDEELSAWLDPRHVEYHLLDWARAGWIEYRGLGRDMLLALPPAPSDSRERVAALLADYRAGQDARLAEIKTYAHTPACRHGHISAYFGGRRIEQCAACDNCGAAIPGAAAPGAPFVVGASAPSSPPRRPQSPTTTPAHPAWHGDPTYPLLQAVRDLPFAPGRTALARILAGASTSPIKGDRFPLFGILAGTTQERIRALADDLVARGLLELYKKGRFPLLRLTDQGRAWLASHPPEKQPAAVSPGRVDEPPQPAAPSRRPGRNKQAGDEGAPESYDLDLYQRLRAWRLETARAIAKPPYIVFPDRTLQEIATSRPATLAELEDIHGVGPRKLELYGEAVLKIVAGE